MWLGYVVTAVVGLSAAALGALLTAQAVLRAAREERRANRVRDAEHVLAEYQAAAALAYSELSELPPVPPPNRLARAIDRIPSKQLKIALWLTVQRGTLRYFGTRPRELTTRLAYAMAQVHVRIHDERIRSAMEKISDYLIELSGNRTDELIARWGPLRHEFEDAVEDYLERVSVD